MDGIEDGSLEAGQQPADGVSLAPKITGRGRRGRLVGPGDRASTAMIRACTPAPGAWTTLDGERVKVGPVTPPPDDATLAPGEIAAQQARRSTSAPARRCGSATSKARQEADGRGGLGAAGCPAGRARRRRFGLVSVDAWRARRPSTVLAVRVRARTGRLRQPRRSPVAARRRRAERAATPASRPSSSHGTLRHRAATTPSSTDCARRRQVDPPRAGRAAARRPPAARA